MFFASSSKPNMGLSENLGTLFRGPCNKHPTIQGTISESPIFGNPHIVGRRTLCDATLPSAWRPCFPLNLCIFIDLPTSISVELAMSGLSVSVFLHVCMYICMHGCKTCE